MSSVTKLIGLQELEIEIASLEKVLADSQGKVGESPALRQAKENVKRADDTYKKLVDHQKEMEWQSEDINTKLKAVNEKLYSGRVTNPKELTSLQQEAGILSGKANELDGEALDVIEKAEIAGQSLSREREKLKQAEGIWHVEQQQLKEEIDNIQEKLATLKEKRSGSIEGISSHAMQLYERVKQQRGVAVARVTQGTCGGCRIGLSTAQLQRARGETLERCGNCGRILFCE
jgi:predicted  nucleic acid-binding Zn-ribbon protein